jgi:diketogulonate reductase-like aldo/keto reductase
MAVLTDSIINANRLYRVTLPDGTKIPRLGQGTWHMGEIPEKASEEIASLKLGIDLGMKLIDTAEMYADGNAERIAAQAIRGCRDDVFLVSKVYPHNSGLADIEKSCSASLKRLGTDNLDLYLLHWKGSVPFEETAEGMERLISSGKILRWGVSNLDTGDMKEITGIQSKHKCCVDQVLYHAASRGIEFNLINYLEENNIPIMAYCPIAQAGALRRGILENKVIHEIAAHHKATPAQILLSWVMRSGNVIAIPKAGTKAHVAENAGANTVILSDDDLKKIDETFPKPSRKEPLDIV